MEQTMSNEYSRIYKLIDWNKAKVLIKKSAEYQAQIKKGDFSNIIGITCNGFCGIGQGGVSADNKTFSKDVLNNIFTNGIPEKSVALWKNLYSDGKYQLTRENGNGDHKKTVQLIQLCHRIMVICYPTEFLDISSVDELKKIADWINSMAGEEKIKIKGETWYDLNKAIFEHLTKMLKTVKRSQDDNLEYGICSMAWVLKNYIDMNLYTLLEESKNLILTGAPGTGKTYLAKEIAKDITGDTDENDHPHYEMVQFHPSYDYSDFVEGLRPVKDAKGNIGFERMDGVFKTFCKKALNDGYTKTQDEKWEYKEDAPKYVFIIDEINRGEMSKIFGELFFSIDPGYRGTDGRINTQYQNLIQDEDEFTNGFFVPENVYIIGTMNDIDRSVESMDFAMRRRFMFKEVRATDRESMLDQTTDAKFVAMAKRKMHHLNYRIQEIEGFNEAYHVGPAYYTKVEDGDFKKLWETRIKGLLYEYLRGMPNATELMESLERAYNAEEDEYVEVKDGVLSLISSKRSYWQNSVVNKPKKTGKKTDDTENNTEDAEHNPSKG